MDAWLIILSIVMSVVMLAVNIYLFVIYCHPDDLKMGVAWFAKIIIIFGYFLCTAFLLLIPLDISNSRGLGGGLTLEALYQIMFLVVIVFTVFVVPYTLLVYETDDESALITRLLYALFSELFILVIFGILALIAFGTMKTAQLSELQVQSVSALALSESLSSNVAS